MAAAMAQRGLLGSALSSAASTVGTLRGSGFGRVTVFSSVGTAALALKVPAAAARPAVAALWGPGGALRLGGVVGGGLAAALLAPGAAWTWLVYAARGYDALFQRRPWATAVGTMGVKASCSDMIAQKSADPQCELDYSRITKFTVFSMMYSGCIQHFVFGIIYTRLFGSIGLVAGVKKSLFDNFVHAPLLYLPVYFAYKGAFSDDEGIFGGLEQYSREGLELVKTLWVIWIPAQLMTFTVVPVNFRFLFIAVVGLVWEVTLSRMAPMKDPGSSSEPAPPPAA